MKHSLKQYRLYIIAVISFMLSWGLYVYFLGTDVQKESIAFQKKILNLDAELEIFTHYVEKNVANKSTSELWDSKDLLESKFGIHVFTNEKLLFWNENNLPFSQLHKSGQQLKSGFSQLANGYYLIKKRDLKGVSLATSIKIKSAYPYENESLENKLIHELSLPNDVKISIDKKTGIPIKNNKNETLFYLTPSVEKNINTQKEISVFFFLILGIALFLVAFGKYIQQLNINNWLKLIGFVALIIIIRWFSFHYEWFSLFNDFYIFQPDLYASSSLFPSFGSLVINTVLLCIITWWIFSCSKNISLAQQSDKGDKLISKIGYFTIYLLLLPFSHFISWLFSTLILNSSISLEVDEVFSLSIFSIITLLVITALFFCYYILAHRIIYAMLLAKIQANIIAMIWFVTGVSYFIFEITYGHGHLFGALWPIILNGVLFYLIFKKNGTISFGYGIIVLTVFSAYSAYNLYEFNQINEYEKRDLYAHQLISEKDPTVEIEYKNLSQSLKDNEKLQRILNEPHELTASLLKSTITSCCFSQFWDRFEITLFLYDKEEKKLLDYISTNAVDFSEINGIINKHGERSEFHPNLFYIKDYYNQLSYVAKEKIRNKNGEYFQLFLQFRSKKIPEQIGIPRLLINHTANALEDLEVYSIARYSGDKLIMRFGDYNYPTIRNKFIKKQDRESDFFNENKYNHFFLQQSDEQSIVVSKRRKSFFQNLTSFSYLFLFFGLNTLIILAFSRSWSLKTFKRLQLSIKIKLVLIGIVVVSFVVFGIVSGTFVKKQYISYTLDNLKERIYSVETEVQQKLGGRDTLDAEILGPYMQYILQKFSAVFVTDINLYNLDGELLASSQPSIYEKGISAKQMNPMAFHAFYSKKKSEFIHTEKIGKLSYLAAYLPFINNKGTPLGYLNLQHFAKQSTYENQISGFLITIINIGVLLLVITVIIAIFVSTWITTPLRLIQQNFKTVELGKANKPIAYESNDEIGALVKDYNNKLAELELKAMQLARSERETAWREMAKQVAHEIKNPLTPMKLVLQHFQRSYDPKAADAPEKLQRLVKSLIEQIDTLTKIANEFSDFAKMPKANEEEINLLPLIKNCLDLYDTNENDIKFSTNCSEVVVFADRDLMIRVFNNILKNALQAIPSERKPLIEIEISSERKGYLIAISDNGIGITSQEKNKIFVPNFTTKSTGAGIGLAMVKQIIQNHNGEIWFESTPKEGTTFYIYLPGI